MRLAQDQKVESVNLSSSIRPRSPIGRGKALKTPQVWVRIPPGPVRLTMNVITKDCCGAQRKTYCFANNCRSCWRCETCHTLSCDINANPHMNDAIHNEPNGVDTDVVIMKIRETTRVYYRGNTPNIKWQGKSIPYSFMRVDKVGGAAWAIDIGPTDKPIATSISIGNIEIPIIVTE